MTPKQFIRYTQMLDKKGLAICDGSLEGDMTSMEEIAWTLYLLGIPVFMWIVWKIRGFVEEHKK